MAVLLTPTAAASEAAARAELRRQIARLDRRLLELEAPPAGVRGGAGPALLDLAGLERIRDGLAVAVARAERAARAQAAAQAAARARLEALIAAPQRHRRAAVALHELGLPGCGVYRARPVLGPVGRLAGWWRVVLSSGCP